MWCSPSTCRCTNHNRRAWRTPPTHHILHVGHEARGIQPGGADDPSTGLIDRDDYLDGLWLQAGSQWDSLSHVRHRQHGNYNGIADQEIHGGPGTKLGVDQWARRRSSAAASSSTWHVTWRASAATTTPTAPSR